MPRVALAPLTAGQSDDEEGGRKLHDTIAFLTGMAGGPKGKGMPRDVFRVVLEFLRPAWDPLRCGVVGAGP